MPHSEILGSQLVCSSPRLIAACHVLHRLSVPRHPPRAFCCLISNKRLSNSVSAANEIRRQPRSNTQMHPRYHQFSKSVPLVPSGRRRPRIDPRSSATYPKRIRVGKVRATLESFSRSASIRRYLRVSAALLSISRKEVIQPQVPLRLPCYDFAPVTEFAFGRSLPRVGSRTSGTPGFHGVTGGVYKARERIHRGMADPRLLAIPASCSRVTDCNPN